jgi:hypothetical protein
VFTLERELIARIEKAEDHEAERERIDDELYEADGDHLFGLDLGVASTVLCLSAARCVPFTSCNAGAFGGHHHERYPLVAFFARPETADLIVAAGSDAEIGLENGETGCVIAFANDIRDMRRFAEALLNRSLSFRKVCPQRPARPARPASTVAREQCKLPFV